MQAFSPPALPGSTGGPPMQFVIRTTGDYATLADVALKMQQAARRERPFPLHRRRPQVRHAAISCSRSTPTRRTASASTCRYRHGARDHARRQLRQPVQPVRPQLSGHSAGAARIPPDAGLADPLSAAHQQRRARAALGGRERLRTGAAERADQLPAAQFRDAVGRALPRPHARRGARFPEGEVEGDFSRGLHLSTSRATRGNTSRKATRSFTSSCSR